MYTTSFSGVGTPQAALMKALVPKPSYSYRKTLFTPILRVGSFIIAQCVPTEGIPNILNQI